MGEGLGRTLSQIISLIYYIQQKLFTCIHYIYLSGCMYSKTSNNEPSEKRTTSLQGTNGPSPKCPLFGGFTVYMYSCRTRGPQHCYKQGAHLLTCIASLEWWLCIYHIVRRKCPPPIMTVLWFLRSSVHPLHTWTWNKCNSKQNNASNTADWARETPSVRWFRKELQLLRV